MEQLSLQFGPRSLPATTTRVFADDLRNGSVSYADEPANVASPFGVILVKTRNSVEILQGASIGRDPTELSASIVEAHQLDLSHDHTAAESLIALAKHGLFVREHSRAKEHAAQQSNTRDVRVPTPTKTINNIRTDRGLQEAMQWLVGRPLSDLTKLDWKELLAAAFASANLSRQSLSEHAETCERAFRSIRYKQSIGRQNEHAERRAEDNEATERSTRQWLQSIGVDE